MTNPTDTPRRSGDEHGQQGTGRNRHGGYRETNRASEQGQRAVEEGTRTATAAMQYPLEQGLALQQTAARMFVDGLELGQDIQRRGVDMTKQTLENYVNSMAAVTGTVQDNARQVGQQATPTAQVSPDRQRTTERYPQPHHGGQDAHRPASRQVDRQGRDQPQYRSAHQGTRHSRQQAQPDDSQGHALQGMEHHGSSGRHQISPSDQQRAVAQQPPPREQGHHRSAQEGQRPGEPGQQQDTQTRPGSTGRGVASHYPQEPVGQADRREIPQPTAPHQDQQRQNRSPPEGGRQPPPYGEQDVHHTQDQDIPQYWQPQRGSHQGSTEPSTQEHGRTHPEGAVPNTPNGPPKR